MSEKARVRFDWLLRDIKALTAKAEQSRFHGPAKCRDEQLAAIERGHEAALRESRARVEQLRKHECSSCDFADDERAAVVNWNRAIDAATAALSAGEATGPRETT
jgi:ElaB/YqjD/DUF883 family membrane-anchored ribosome-binding protein